MHFSLRAGSTTIVQSTIKELVSCAHLCTPVIRSAQSHTDLSLE